MRVFISVDMEGVAGIVHWDQVEPGGGEYEWARRLMIGEANAAAVGAFEGGATGVVVNDSHYHMRNLLPGELDPRVRLVSGSPKPLSMMEGLQDGGFGAVFLVGYHAAAGHAGVLAHTYSSATVHRLWLNGQPAGELAVNAAVAGALGVPVALVTGDAAVVAEARELLGEVETVAVKEPRGRYAAANMHPEAAREAIRTAAARAVKRAPGLRPWLPEPPYAFEVAFMHPAMADCALLLPGAERVDAVTVRYAHDDYLTAYRAMRALMGLARLAL